MFIDYRAQHPVKVHVNTKISLRGATRICIFEGIMDKELFAQIQDERLLCHTYTILRPTDLYAGQ